VISWGRRRLTLHGPTLTGTLALVLASVAAVCASGGLAPTVERPKEDIVAGDARRAIQDTLDQHVDAVARGDAFVWERTLDRRDAGFVRCMRELFELRDAHAQALRPNRVVDLKQVGPALARVQVQERDGIATLYMRRLTIRSLVVPLFDIWRTFHVWYVTPAARGELGPLRTATQGEVSVTYAEADEALVGPLLREAAAARNAGLSQASPARSQVRLRLVPEREHAGPATCRVEAQYDRAADEVLLYRYWTDASGAPAARSRAAITEGVLNALRSR
jgi:hypothetical protein